MLCHFNKAISTRTSISLLRPTAAVPSFRVNTSLATCTVPDSESSIQVTNGRATCMALELVSTWTSTAGAIYTVTARELVSAVVLALPALMNVEYRSSDRRG